MVLVSQTSLIFVSRATTEFEAVEVGYRPPLSVGPECSTPTSPPKSTVDRLTNTGSTCASNYKTYSGDDTRFTVPNPLESHRG